MTKIGAVKLLLEMIFVSLLISFLPIPLELKIKLILLYAFMQFAIGRYRGKSLLFYEEVRLLLLSITGYFIGIFLVVPSNDITIIRVLYIILITLFSTFIARLKKVLLRIQVK